MDDIAAFVADGNFAAFRHDRRTYHAVVRCLEIISEATRHLPLSLKHRHPDVAWRQIAGAGNIYRHGYDAVTPRRIWDTATIHVPALRPAIEAELQERQT
ncbi:MAG: DUF86 domain-containing protein [Rhodospirillaceae bacterium]|nr:DUF86 domain-containing protein [Rhodospirillaceae bacterium]